MLTCVEMSYIGSIDVLVIIRSDMCFEFLKFASRSKITSEFIISAGFHDLGGYSL
jgi:hypothetical protein